MPWDDVLVLATHVDPVSVEDIEALERDVGARLPVGWRTFVTRFGEGSYCDLFRIYGPDRIRASYREYRERWAEQWFFEGSEHILSQAQALESYPIADTYDGDEIVVHPARADVFMLPRHSDSITTIGPDFADLHLWDGRNPARRTFMPFVRRAQLRFSASAFTIDADTWITECVSEWGRDGVVIAYRKNRGKDWSLVLFVEPVAARMQVLMSSGETYVERHGWGTSTSLRSGQRSLHVDVDCEEGFEPAIRGFIDGLGELGLAGFRATGT